MGAHSNLGVFSDAQAIAAAAASTNTVDLAQAITQVGVGNPVWLNIRTNTAPTDTADSLSIEVQGDADNGSGAPAGSWTTIFMPFTDAAGAEFVASANARILTAGAWIYRGPLPYEITERHLRLFYNNTISNGTFTIDAWLGDGPPQSDFDKQVFVSNVGQP